MPNYEGLYQVSNLGNVRSLDRYVFRSDGIKHFCKGRKLIPSKNKDGYLQIKLCKNSKDKTTKIHRLVAELFVQKPNNNDVLEVNHIDCNRTNNIYTNLEWVTHKENVAYSIKMNNHYCTKNLFGKNNPNYGNHKLKEVYKNKELAKEKMSRPGAQNGRARPVQIIFSNNKTLSFKYLGECAEYLLCNGYTKSKIDSIRSRIAISIKTDKKYLGLKFKYL